VNNPQNNNPDLDMLLDSLKALGYRFTRPLEVRSSYLIEPTNTKMLRAVILDTETTGTDYTQDRVIELGMVAFDYCPHTGMIGDVHGTFNQLEDPGFPIPPESTKVHHITDDMVAGKHINDDEVEAFIASASLIIAHNSRFDRRFVEPRFPIFKSKPWACSFAHIDWAAEGLGSSKLEFLAYRSGFHYEGHRASTDCHALLEVLHCAPTESGMLPMKQMLDNARLKEYKVSALLAPFESKDLLKARGYRWNAERKVWHTFIQEPAFTAEAEWLKSEVYNDKKCKIERESIDAFNRFSDRVGVLELIDC
jgi:DNA polymerase-3 subunit epsilon